MTNIKKRTWLVCLTLIAAAATAALPLRAGEADHAPVKAVEAGSRASQDLNRLAMDGQFNQLLASLQASPDSAQDPQVVALEKDIVSFEQHRQKAGQTQAAAFTKAAARMEEQIKAGEIEEAVVSAVDAHGLAADREAFLADPRVVALVKSAEDAAVAAEKGGDWIEALSLYRVLDYLYEDHGTYKNRVKTTSRHVRVLRFYAPARFDELMQARFDRLEKFRAADLARDKAAGRLDAKAAKAAEKPAQKLSHRDDESWREKLADIDLNMFRGTLGQAAKRHVSNKGYAPLLDGAIDGLLTMINTQGLEASFPTFKDKDKLQKFRVSLLAMRKDVDNDPENFNWFDASNMLKRISAANNDTVAMPESALTYELTEGALDTLDEFSSVIWPREKESFSRNFQGKFFGVGIQIALHDDQLVVVSPLEGTPAQQAGIKAGDLIVSVDGRDTSGWSLDQAVREITGPEGTPVTMGLSRPGKPQPLIFKLKRAEIPIESIRGWQHKPEGGWDYFVDRQSKIGYIRLSQFIPQSADDLDAAINQMQKEGGCDALIIDLRFDPGGLLMSAVDVANRFVPTGVIVSTTGSGDVHEYRADPAHSHDRMPLVVLVNQGSASASEIVSGALQDYQRATIIGTRSFGKGSVQDVFSLEGGKAYLKLTTQYYQLPKGRIIHRKPESRTWGIEPDVKVPMTTEQVADWIELRQKADVLQSAVDPDEPGAEHVPPAQQILDKGMDPQLETALLVLKTKLISPHIHLAQDAGAPAAEK